MVPFSLERLAVHMVFRGRPVPEFLRERLLEGAGRHAQGPKDGFLHEFRKSLACDVRHQQLQDAVAKV